MADRSLAPTWVTKASFGVLTLNSGLAMYCARGDSASVLFVAGSYLTLLLLFVYLRAYERAAPTSPAGERARRAVRPLATLLTLALGVVNSVLAIYTSWGDAASVATVLAADAALVQLFLCLRVFEQGGGGRADDAKIKAALWVLTTLLTVMFSGYPSKVAPPLVVGALVFLCLREFDRSQIGLGGQYAELVKMGFGVVACDSALAHHHARSDAGSLAFVFVAYVGFVTLTWRFLRRFDGRARRAGQ